MTIPQHIQTIVMQGRLGTRHGTSESVAALFIEAKAACGANSEKLVSHLLEKFTFLNNEQYDDSIDSIAQWLDDSGLLTPDTVFCATSMGHEKDSAQRVLYDVSTALGMRGHLKVRTYNLADKLHKAEGVRNVVFVDEFTGTGETIAKRIETVGDRFRQAGKDAPAFHAALVAGMAKAMELVGTISESSMAVHVLKPGLSGYLNGADLLEALQQMEVFEDGLEQAFSDRDLPRLGWGKAEALYSRHRGNCPNNVFPVFWWPLGKGNVPRKPIFPRTF